MESGNKPALCGLQYGSQIFFADSALVIHSSSLFSLRSQTENPSQAPVLNVVVVDAGAVPALELEQEENGSNQTWANRDFLSAISGFFFNQPRPENPHSWQTQIQLNGETSSRRRAAARVAATEASLRDA